MLSDSPGAGRPVFASTAHVREMASVLGLVVRPDWEVPVVNNLAMLELAAQQVLTFELPDDIESAVVFAPR